MAWIREFKKNGVKVDKFYTEDIAKEFFSRENTMEKTDVNQTEHEKEIEKIIYDSIVTDEFKAVSVVDGHIYIIID